VSTSAPESESRFRFFLAFAGIVIGVGVLAFFVFILITKAVYAWGVLGAFLVVAALVLGWGWLHDRRNPPPDPDSYR
jgi:membrane protein implicated in regulation of membrane protease activity